MPSKRGGGGSRRSASTAASSRDGHVEMDGPERSGFGDLEAKQEKLKYNMIVDADCRKAEKQRRIEEAFKEQVHQLEDHIKKRINDHREEMSRIQDATMTRLLDLIQKKASIEMQIVQHVQDLTKVYEEVKGEFQTVVEGRLEEVQDAILQIQERNTSPNGQS